MIERLQADADIAVHGSYRSKERGGSREGGRLLLFLKL
jgi:hypothetical protein